MLPLALYHVVNEKNSNILACHWHEEIEIIYLAVGKAVFTIDDASFLINAGDCLFINGSQIHTGFAKSDYTEYYSVVFSTDLLTNPFDACRVFFEGIIANTYKVPSYFNQNVPVYSKIICEIKDVVDELVHKNMAYELAVKSKLYSIFYLIFKENLYIENKGNQKNSIHSPRYDMLKKVLGYIYSNYNKKIKLKDIGDYVNFTPQYLCVFFKEMTKTKLVDYINQYRIETAANLLKVSELSITEIALECGFDNPSYFNRVFKKQMGCTPTSYRSTNLIT